MKIFRKHGTIEKIIVWRLTMPRGRRKQNVLTLEEQLVTVNERIQEVESELKQLRSQRKEIQEKIEEQKKETLFRAVIASGRTVEDVLAILRAQDQREEQ